MKPDFSNVTKIACIVCGVTNARRASVAFEAPASTRSRSSHRDRSTATSYRVAERIVEREVAAERPILWGQLDKEALLDKIVVERVGVVTAEPNGYAPLHSPRLPAREELSMSF